MAKINFPDNPQVDDEFVLDDTRKYVWDGSTWQVVLQTASPGTAAPTITIVETAPTGVTFTLTNNDDNTAIVSYTVSTSAGAVSLAASATSSNITVDLAAGTYTLTAVATVVGEVATSATASVEIVVPQYELLYDSETANNGNPIPLPTTQIDITGLNIGKDDTLRLVTSMIGDSTTTAFYQLRANDISTNYTGQYLAGNGSTTDASRSSTNFSAAASFAFAASNAKTQANTDIKISNNDRFVIQSYISYFIGSQSSSLANYNNNIVNTSTVSSITKLSIVSSRTNGIATGSRIKLYKVNTGAA